jgi:hypothetical protein
MLLARLCCCALVIMGYLDVSWVASKGTLARYSFAQS